MQSKIVVFIAIMVMTVALTGCGGGGGNSVPPGYTVYELDKEIGYGLITLAPDRSMTLKTHDDYGKTITLAGTMSPGGTMEVRGKDSRGDSLRMWAYFTEDHYGLYTDEIYYQFDDELTVSHSVRNSFMFYRK